MTLLDTARTHLRQGIGTLPAKPRGKAVALATWAEYQTRLPTDDELAGWFSNGTPHNLWVVCGKISRLLILDLDNEPALRWWRAQLRPHGIDLDLLPYVKTARGWHFWFRTPAGLDVPHWSRKDELEFEVRGDGLGTICPPSTHQSGHIYRWTGDPSGLLELTPNQLALFAKPANTRHPLQSLVTRVTAKLAARSEPGRNNLLNESALKLGHYVPHLLDERQVTDALVEACRSNGLLYDDGSTAVLATIRSGLQRGMAEPYQLATEPRSDDEGLSDAQAAELLLTKRGRDFRFTGKSVEREGGLWVWTGTHWREDEHTIRSWWLEVARDQQRQALEIPALPDKRRALAERLRLESDYGTRAVLRWAKALNHTDLSAFDTDPWLLNLANGTLDLRTGQLRKPRREDLITKLAPGRYDPDATCPEFDAFLERTSNNDPAWVRFFWRYFGMTLTGSVSDKRRLLILQGNPDAGKTTISEIVQAILGLEQYAVVMLNETLLAIKSHGGNQPELVALRGARFAALSETSKDARLNIPQIKALTGGNTISAMRKFENPVSFLPVAKYWLDTNNLPNVPDGDDALWNRVLVLPFDVTLGRDEWQRRPPPLLHLELDGILARAVQGCLEWQRDGLCPPERVLLKTQSYRQDQDEIARFLASGFVVVDPEAKVKPQALHDTYHRWGGRLSAAEFKAALEEKGYQQKTTKGYATWRGIGLPAGEDEPRAF